jgi:hypothetical protein
MFWRGMDGSEARGSEPVGRRGGVEEERRATRSSRLAVGTLACPACDAPVALAGRRLAPSAGLECPYCGHAGVLRDFLSLAVPARPARVEVRVVRRDRRSAPVWRYAGESASAFTLERKGFKVGGDGSDQ